MIMININNFIQEKLKINSKSQVHQYEYQPKNKDELKKNIQELISKRKSKSKIIDLNSINTINIEDMSNLFYEHGYVCKLNFDCSQWNVKNVTNMDSMFKYCVKFDCDLSNWDVSNVKTMKDMFQGTLLENNPPKWYHE